MTPEEIRFDLLRVVLAGRGIDSPEYAAIIVKIAAELEAYILRGFDRQSVDSSDRLICRIDDIIPINSGLGVSVSEMDGLPISKTDAVDEIFDQGFSGVSGVSHNVSPVDVLGSPSTVSQPGPEVEFSRSGNGGAA